MAWIEQNQVGNNLQALLDAPDIQPGDDPSYQLCKSIYLYHPLGGKLAEAPIALAQSQERKITMKRGPEEECRDAFVKEWKALKMTDVLFNTETTKRIYGIASTGIIIEGQNPAAELDYQTLWKQDISFSVWDPLTTAGSLVFNQNPNAIDYMKSTGSIRISGQEYHRSRVITRLNGQPIYLAYTSASFGFVGRSVYQRGLYALKSFIQTMKTDDMVALKSGVLVAKMEQAGSVVDQAMKILYRGKASKVKEAQTSNVLTIGITEGIETLNMQNLDGAYGMARANILNNLATSAEMPAILIENETMVSGFGEGTEDAKNIAQFIERERLKLEEIYAWADKIVMYRAWNPQWYESIQKAYPDEYGSMTYEDAFHQFQDNFQVEWPNVLQEADSEKAGKEEVKLKAAIAWFQVLFPVADPATKAKLVEWATDNFNDLKLLFPNPLLLDIEELETFFETQKDQQDDLLAQGGAAGDMKGAPPTPPKPFANAA